MTVSLEEATIVIVEDDANSRMATEELLKLNGATKIHPFNNGDSAMIFVENLGETEQVDLFLLDIHMPGETGYDLVKRLKKAKKLKNAKAIALTAGVLFDDIRRARMSGFNGFIGKPIKPFQFAEQIKRVLAGEAVWEWR